MFDSNAVIHRAYHALPPFTTKDGQIVNAVYGYASLLMKVMAELKPDALIASFDVSGKTFRHEQFEEYKAQRKKMDDDLAAQIPLVKELVRTLDIPVLELKGYEADDVIGTIAQMVAGTKGYELIIVTGDMDTMQLVVDGKVQVYGLRKGVNDVVLYDEQAVIDKYSIRPDQVRDFKGLKGDQSDNIPGVPGIGDKRAVELISHFETLEAVLAYVEKFEDFTDIPKEERYGLTKAVFGNLKEFTNQAIFSKELATILTDVPLEFELSQIDEYEFPLDKAREVFSRFEFFSLIKRLPQPAPRTSQGSLLSTPSEQSSNLLDQVTNVSDLQDPIGIWFEKDTWTLVDSSSRYSASQEEVWQLLEQERSVIGYSLKPTVRAMLMEGRNPQAQIDDIELMAYLVQPGERKYDLESLALELGINYQPEQAYASLIPVWSAIKEQLSDKQVLSVYEDIERPLLYVLAEMEAAGVFFDTDALVETKQYVDTRISELTTQIYAISGEEFNLNSPKQLSEILFERLGISTKGLKKTSGGQVSTSAEVLETLADEYEIAKYILEYRELAKLKSTYIDVLPTLRDEQGRIHTTYQQTVAATGRLSSIDPNLQNIPARSELGRKIKHAFRAPARKKLLACDYSQIELRLASHLSGDQHMQDIFRLGKDFHAATAARVYDVSEEAVTKEMRSFAKTINFGILYGMGSVSLGKNLGIPRKEAQDFLEKYRAAYPQLHEYIDQQKEFAREHGYSVTEYGRIRDLSGFDSKNPRLRSMMERIAVNMPIQGLQADIIKIAMIQIQDRIRNDDGIQMLLQVHDELVFEVEESKAEEYATIITELMESVYQAEVPILVDSEIHDYWA